MSTSPLSARKLIHSILLSKGRMEALTDGIFAIAMTLLVLELKVPDLPKHASATELLLKIGEEGPSLFSFMLSFLYCGLLWVMHHLAMHFVRHLQIGLVWLNLVFLMSISTMPFSCGLLGHFLRNRAAQEIYFANMFVAAALLAAQWLVAKKKKLLNEDDPRASTLMGQQIMFFPIALGAAMAASYFNPLAGSYAFIFVLLALRIWQRRWHRKNVANPARPSS
ncbi:MAG TPA: TMEM175 family protein [Candidatus Polarisedimenticolia bacterium]|nr:TMEM175 family protein [Candidatus Polarisedimenticolia bacterium]